MPAAYALPAALPRRLSNTDTDGGIGYRFLDTLLAWHNAKTSSALVVATATNVTALPLSRRRSVQYQESFPDTDWGHSVPLNRAGDRWMLAALLNFAQLQTAVAAAKQRFDLIREKYPSLKADLVLSSPLGQRLGPEVSLGRNRGWKA